MAACLLGRSLRLRGAEALGSEREIRPAGHAVVLDGKLSGSLLPESGASLWLTEPRAAPVFVPCFGKPGIFDHVWNRSVVRPAKRAIHHYVRCQPHGSAGHAGLRGS